MANKIGTQTNETEKKKVDLVYERDVTFNVGVLVRFLSHQFRVLFACEHFVMI